MPKRGGSRGRKKMSLRDLSRRLPTSEEFAEIIEALDTADARSAVLTMAALLDHHLEKAININFIDISDARSAAIFRDPNAPLSSFSSKILIARALNVTNDKQTDYLDRIRAIRNHFAHTIVHASFEEDLVKGMCDKLDPQGITEDKYQPTTDSSRERFCISATLLLTDIMKYIRQLSGLEIRISPASQDKP